MDLKFRVSSLVEQDSKLQKICSLETNPSFQSGLELYLKGDWIGARSALSSTSARPDGPTNFLLTFMEENSTDEGKAKSSWEGFRENVL